jgi:class 3 adenylate cyclase
MVNKFGVILSGVFGTRNFPHHAVSAIQALECGLRWPGLIKRKRRQVAHLQCGIAVATGAVVAGKRERTHRYTVMVIQ